MRTYPRLTRWPLVAALLPVFGVAALAGAEAGNTPEIATEELTVITSERLTYDAERQFVVFERNVVVNDPSLKLTADHLTVRLSDTNEVESILAVGNVVMNQEDRKAWAQRALYNVATGIIVLEGEPRVMRGRDLLAGDRITFWRDEQRMICEPHARLVIYPDSDGVRDTLTKEH